MHSGPRSGEKMNAQLNRELPNPAMAVQALVAEHGLVRVALALAALIARPRRHAKRAWDADLPDRVRRDIGLEPLPRARNYWEL